MTAALDHGSLRGIVSERKFNPAQARVPGGEHGGEWTVAGLVRGVIAQMDSVKPTDDNQFGFPDSVISQYGEGDCMRLAAAVQALTGGPYRGLKLTLLTSDEGATGHVITQSPDGRTLDISGVHDDDYWHVGQPGFNDAAMPVSVEKLERLGWSPYPTIPDLEVAQAILERIGAPVDPDDVEHAWYEAARRADLDNPSEVAKAARERAGRGPEPANRSKGGAWAMTAALETRATDPKEPYGDVKYADPGYQSDGKKRYPLDTEAHCRAAWSYINQAGNASMYSAEQLKAIKGRIKAAGKKYGIEFADTERSDTSGEYRRAVPEVCVRAFDFETKSVSGDGRTLEGYVAVFGSVARIPDHKGDFDEEIHRGAFDRSLSRSMPVMQFEHGRDPRVGALPIGVYEVFEPDHKGYFVRGRLLDDPVVDPIRKAIEARAIKGMSWRMQVGEQGQRWNRRGGQVDKRDVLDADVPEAGPVVFPAYNATTVGVRSLLAAMDSHEIRTLVHELAAHVGLAVDLSDISGRSDARSTDGADLDAATQERRASTPAPQPHLRQRLDEGALRLRGILQ